jgi:hypothetical protein
METSHYHCSAEWHFARLNGRGRFFAAALYSFAFHLSKKTGRFYASIPRMAEYFGVDERTVRHALRQLEKTGFFEVVSKPAGQAIEYRPVGHKEWREKYSGKCVTKGTQNERANALGRLLYTLSAGRFNAWPNYLKGLRRIGAPWAALTDEQIANHFKNFLPTYVPKDNRHWSQGLCSKFKDYVWGQQMPAIRAGRAAAMAGQQVGQP